MKYLSILFYGFLLSFIIFSCTGSNDDDDDDTLDILDQLQELEGVSVMEIQPPGNFEGRAFQLDVTQNIDHNNPTVGSFSQRCYLSHRDVSDIMVLNTRGYFTTGNSIVELTPLLEANQLTVTHRYFNNARPDTVDWQYLTIEQAAADHHHIVDLLKQIYSGKWVSTGSSKGGMTAFFHRRFYPEDVDVTVSYVAPLMFGLEDPRFDNFLLNQVGTEECRSAVMEFQRQLLENRDELIMRFEETSYHFSIGTDVAFEYAVLEYLFFFWQYYRDGDCESIPGDDASIDEMFNKLRSYISYYADEGIELFEPFWYQAMTELGYYRLITEHLSDLLISVTDPTFEIFAPQDVDLIFKPEVMIDVDSWLKSYGDNIIFIYGGLDPYTSTSVELTGQTNALKVVQPGGSHGVRIADLDQRELVVSTLEDWLETDITAPIRSIEQEPLHKETQRLIEAKSKGSEVFVHRINSE